MIEVGKLREPVLFVLCGRPGVLFRCLRPLLLLPLPAMAGEPLQKISTAQHGAMSLARGLLNAVIVGDHGQMFWGRRMPDPFLNHVVRFFVPDGKAHVQPMKILLGSQAGRRLGCVEDDRHMIGFLTVSSSE